MKEQIQQHHNSPLATPIKPPKQSSSLSHPRLPFSGNPQQLASTQARNIFQNEPQGKLYGTTISISRCQASIQHFLLNYTVTIQCQQSQQFITQRLYAVKLNQLQTCLPQEHPFMVDGQHLYNFNKELYLQLVYYPVEIIHLFDIVLQELYQKMFVQENQQEEIKVAKRKRKENIKVAFVNLEKKEKVGIRDLGVNMLGRLVGIKGLVVKMSQIIPQLKTAVFRCLKCKQQLRVNLCNARVQQPKRCPSCHCPQSLQLDHNLSIYTDKQYIHLQQLLTNLTQSQTPSSIKIISYDTNVDKFQPGDTIQITGIYRCHPLKIQRGGYKQMFRNVFQTYFDTIGWQILQVRENKIGRKQGGWNDKDRKMFIRMANRDNVIDQLVDSFAPSIYGHRQIKKGILAQLLAGSYKTRQTGGRFRNQINICLMGDPSTAKSQLLQQVHRIAPRSVYTCGRGSSTVGLTAHVKKDPQTRQFVLQSGALVLSDEGVCCIDQFDKMNENTRTVLLQVMEQQTISVAKAGIVCQLNSRTAILAAANPILSKYDPSKSIIQNINLSPALLTRFDLLYIMLDVASEEEDRAIAKHILDIYSEGPKEKKKVGMYTMEEMAKFISFAKEVRPKLSQEAGFRIREEYLKLRKEGMSYNSITATPRLLQSMIRLSQAFAKMRLSNQVTSQDAQQAIQLINFATVRSATDPQTGKIDFDLLQTGRSENMRRKTKQFAFKLKQFMLANQQKFSQAILIDKVEEMYNKMNPREMVEREELLEGLLQLKTQDFVYLFGKDAKKRPLVKLQKFNEIN